MVMSRYVAAFPAGSQCNSWLLMRYPITRPVRAGLVKFYYQLILVPGMEPRIIRTWADMIQRLLASKPGMKRKLELTDLELPWEPLWRVMHKELWPKGRNNDSSCVLPHIPFTLVLTLSQSAATWSTSSSSSPTCASATFRPQRSPRCSIRFCRCSRRRCVHLPSRVFVTRRAHVPRKVHIEHHPRAHLLPPADRLPPLCSRTLQALGGLQLARP